MDKSKPPGISFEEVVLKESTVKIPEGKPAGKILYEFDFDVQSVIDSDTRLSQDLMFTVTARDESGAEIDGFLVAFTLMGVFSADEDEPNLDLEKFSTFQAPALLVPFARELLYSMTMRSRWRDVLMPPINVIAFLKAKDALKREEQGKQEQEPAA